MIEKMGPFITPGNSLYHVFLELAAKERKSDEYVKRLIKLLPQALKEAKVGFDNLAMVWRYEYGEPFDIKNTKVIGANNFVEVDRLYRALSLADQFLPPMQLLDFIKALENPAKHEDFVFEMRPLLKFRRTNQVPEHETRGYENKRIDWKFQYGPFMILVDVKRRKKGLLDHLERLQGDIAMGKDPTPDLLSNPRDLFKSTEGKFEKSLGIRRIQGVWIQNKLKENQKALEAVFKNEVDSSRIHFCIISNWSEECYILARNAFQKSILVRFFGLVPTGNFTFAGDLGI